MAVENRYQIEVNMKSRMFREVPEVVANDKVIFEITVYDGPDKFPLSAAYTYHLTSLKLGGKSVIREGSMSGDVIVFELGTSEMTVPGKVEGTVQIFDENNDRISSSKFDYFVKRDPSLQGSLPADNTSLIIANESLLTSAVEKSDTAIADSSTALTRAEGAETKATAAENTANQVKSEFDLVVAEAGSNNPEVVQARGQYVNLNDRLAQTDAQLADVVQQKADKTEIGTLTSSKADIAYVDTKVASVASGSPKGVYATLADLQSVYPTGATGSYLVTADGKWYYWNGTAWAAGGQYQSTGISKKSVGIDKVNFVKESSNLFNHNTVTQGIYLALDGTVTSSSSYSMTDFIPVEVGKTYSAYGFVHFSRFDSNKQFINRSDTGGATATYTHTITSGVAYIRLSFQHTSSLLRQVNEGSSLLPYEKWFTPYMEKVNATNLNDGVVENKHIKEKEISFEKTNFINRSSNIFDISTISRGYNLSSADGSLVVNSAYNSSDYIVVNPSTDYTYYGFLNVAYYDANKQFISRPLLDYAGKTLTTPSNAKYIRVHYQPNNSNKPRQINKGSIKLPYEEFYSTFNSDTGLSGLNVLLKKGVINPPDRYIIDLPVDGVYTTNDTFADYTNFGTSTASDVYSMFDGLMTAYPDYITKELLGNDSTGLPMYVYYLNPSFPNADVETKKVKVFLTCGVHGNEKASTLSTYLFVKQMCEKWENNSLLEALRFNVKFVIIPVGNPSGWNAFTRTNANGVDINRNFPFEWVQGTSGTSTYGGSAPLSELESQYIKSVFDNHPDINMMYDFHNFHTDSNGTYFMWIPTASGSYVQHMAQSLFSRLTRKWKKEYTFIPENYHAGYASTAGEGMIQNYANSIGIKYSSTFEICWKWVLDANSVPYDQNTCKSGVEALANWLLINLKELTK